MMKLVSPSGLSECGMSVAAPSTTRSGALVMMITSPSLPDSLARTASFIVMRRPPFGLRKRSGEMTVQIFQSDQKIANFNGAPTMSAYVWSEARYAADICVFCLNGSGLRTFLTSTSHCSPSSSTIRKSGARQLTAAWTRPTSSVLSNRK